MIVTLTSLLSVGTFLNKLGVAEDLVAVGGQRDDPLPYPFTVPENISADGSLNGGDAVVLPVHARDLRRSLSQSSMDGDGLEPGERTNQMVNAGKITYAVATQPVVRDVEEQFLGDIP